MRRHALLAVAGFGVLAWFAYPHVVQSAPQPWTIEKAVPSGFTLVEPDRDFMHARVTIPNASLSNDQGEKLYVLDIDTSPDKSMCAGSCAKAWAPFVAGTDARSFADWSVIAREDGVRQWA